MSLTLRGKLKEAIDLFAAAGIETARLDAEILLCHALHIDRVRLITDDQQLLDEAACAEIDSFVARRVRREPVAYITGEKEFYGLTFEVNSTVLIPRPETEFVVDQALYFAPQRGRVLDLCTGSGAIAVAVAFNRSDLRVTASDVSAAALQVARSNADRIAGSGAVNCIESDLFAEIHGRFSVITVNPPYISSSLEGTLDPELSYEPSIALYSDPAGTDHIERIIRDAHGYLEDSGCLIIEIGYDQKERITELARKYEFSVSVSDDYAGNPRVARLSPL